MLELFRRRRGLTVAATALVLTGACSGSGSGTAAGPASTPVAASPTGGRTAAAGSTAAADAAAALGRAIRATSAVRSYRFSAEQTVTGGPAARTTRLNGRAIRPSSLTYVLSTGGRTQQIVRLGPVTYRRVPPGPYRRLVKATPLTDPIVSVTAIMRRLTKVTSTPSSLGTGFTGSLSGADATASGLVGNAAAAPGLAIPVQVRVDRQGRVTRLELSAPLQAGASRLLLRQVTTYGGFNRQPPITRPR